MVRIVRAAAEKTWQAAAWWLERRRPKAYALRKERFEQSERKLSDDEAAAKWKETTGQDWGTDDLAVAESVVAALKSKRSGET